MGFGFRSMVSQSDGVMSAILWAPVLGHQPVGPGIGSAHPLSARDVSLAAGHLF